MIRARVNLMGAAKKIFWGISIFVLAAPVHFIYAAATGNILGSGSSGNIGGGGGIKLNNPLSGIDSMAAFVSKALEALVVIALPIIGFFIVLAGFLFITARGNESKLETAKKNFFWVVVGAIFILGAWALAQLIGGTVTQLTRGN